MPESSAYLPPTNLKSRLKESYDAIAPRYNEWTSKHSSLRLAYLDKLLPLFHKDKHDGSATIKVLELGCGCGLPVIKKLVEDPRIEVTGNDLSSTQIELAKANLQDSGGSDGGERVTFIQGDMLSLDFASGSFDAVIALYSIIHLPREEQVTVLQRIAEWLKPGGYLLANFAVEASEGSEMKQWLKEEKGWMFWSAWGAEGTIGKIKDSGLEIVLQEVQEDVIDASFVWVLAMKEKGL